MKALWDKIYATFILQDRYLFFVEGLEATLILTFASFLLGTAFGVLLCAAARSGNVVIRKTTQVIRALFMEMPTMVLLMIMTSRFPETPVLPLIPFAALAVALAFLLAGGTKGKRYALPNAEIMIHQPLGVAKGQATEIEIAAKHILQTKEKLNRRLAENCGQPYEVVAADTDRDNWKTAEEAKAYGLIDEVIYKRHDDSEKKDK